MLLVGMQINIAITESSMVIPQKTKARTAIRSSDTAPKAHKLGYNGGTCTPMFTEALFTIAKLQKQPRCPTTDEWIKKMWNIYTQ
jgi:hypothetical protein